MLADKSLTQVLDAFASPDPTPGGGSAAALAGALGASLVAMVAGLPKTKTGTPAEREALDAARAHLLQTRETLVTLIDRDAQAYDMVVAAYRRPKATDAEKADRAAAIQDALKVATEVPLETMRVCAEATAAATSTAEHGNPSAKSDLMIGLQTLGLGMQGAWLNVEANIGSIKDAALVASYTDEMKRLMAQAGEAGRHAYEVAGLIEVMKQKAQRLGMAHGHGVPGPGEPGHTERFAYAAAESLLHMGTPEAREALGVLSRSSDETVAGKARSALQRFADKPRS